MILVLARILFERLTSQVLEQNRLAASHATEEVILLFGVEPNSQCLTNKAVWVSTCLTGIKSPRTDVEEKKANSCTSPGFSLNGRHTVMRRYRPPSNHLRRLESEKL